MKRGSTHFAGDVSVPGLAGFDLFNAGAEESRRVRSASEVELERLQSQDIAFWGDETNLFPQEVLADIETSDILDTVIRWKAQELVGGGVMYGNMVPGPGGLPMLEPLSIPEIDDWLEETNFTLYALESATDYYRYYNAAAELIKVNGTVTGIWSQDMSWVRLAQNDRTGAIRTAYLSGEWEKVASLTSRRVKHYPALDPYYDVAGQLRDGRSERYIMPLRVQTGGRKYYALAPWNGFRESEWFEVHQRVAKAKNALLKHMAIIRYHIEVDDRYWPLAITDWGTLNHQQKLDKKKKTREDFEAWIAGEKNNGKSLMTGMVPLPNSHESYSLWKIHELKFTIPSGAYIEDSTEADHHAIRAHGVQPSLMGISPSKNNSSSGSGSVNRVDRTNHILGERVHADLLLTPMKAVSAVNGWNRRYNSQDGRARPLRWMYHNLYAATLDRTQQVDQQPNHTKTKEDGTVQDND